MAKEKMTEARYVVEFIMEEGHEREDTYFDIWINEREDLHKRLAHQMALGMASERWGMPIMAAKHTEDDVIGTVKGYVLHRKKWT